MIDSTLLSDMDRDGVSTVVEWRCGVRQTYSFSLKTSIVEEEWIFRWVRGGVEPFVWEYRTRKPIGKGRCFPSQIAIRACTEIFDKKLSNEHSNLPSILT